jgi:hypothetical protein
MAERGDLPTNPTNERASLPAAPLGNRRAATHGAYVTRLTPLETTITPTPIDCGAST